MTVYKWSEVAEEQVSPLASRRIICSETMTVIRRQLRKGAVTKLHKHTDEQISMIESGKLRFVVAEEERIVMSGEALAIPSNEPHSVEALEDSVVMDVFSKPQASAS